MIPTRAPLALATALALVLGGTPAPPGARADDDAGVEIEAAEDPEVTVAVVVADAGGAPLAPAIAATLQVSMERALGNDPRLVVVDPDDRLAAAAGRVPDDAITDALALFQAGEELIADGRAVHAVPKLEAATRKLARLLAWTSKGDLARAQLLHGSAQAMIGDRSGAVRTFAALLVWRPEAEPEAALDDPAVQTAWEAAEVAVADAAEGEVDIDATPDGALAYVDGRLVGFTPTVASGLTAGTHYVTVRRDGFERRVDAVDIEGGAPASLRVTLRRSARADELAAARATFAAGAADDEPAGEVRAALATIGELLEVDHVVLVVPGKHDGLYGLSVHATDGGDRLGSIQVRLGDRDLETAFASAAGKLYADITVAPRTRRAARPRPAPVVEVDGLQKPFYKQRWVWAAAGAVVLTAIVVTVVASGDDGPPGCPDGASCGQVLFRF